MTTLRTMVAAGVGLVLAAAAGAAARQDRPQPIDPEAVSWSGPPDNPRLTSAWLVGAEQRPGVYAVRVRLLKDGGIAPHRHPDMRYSTVLSGTLYAGFGEQADASRLVAIPAGSVYVVPAGVPHFVLARDGDVVYQEGGMGPTGTTPVAAPAR